MVKLISIKIEHRFLITIGKIEQETFIFKRIETKIKILKATVTFKFNIIFFLIIKEMIFIESDVSGPLEGEYFTDFIIKEFFISNIRLSYLMMIILFGPEWFIGSESRILDFSGYLDNDSKLFS